jgi:hypothetical protein
MFYRFIHLTSRPLLVGAVGLLSSSLAMAGDVVKPASERFVEAAAPEEPSFQRHVLPLMGRLGCNGRACHGSFQGQGGFRLSLFGYDFKADHEALTKGDKPRTNVEKIDESLILFKPTHEDEHEGGQRMQLGSWQYNVMRRWIASGCKDDSASQATMQRLEVIPPEIQFGKDGQATPLQAIAYWSNGDREDVTPLCRFQTNDGSVASVDENGLVKATGQGDTHIVVYYDNGIATVPVIQPISAELAANYPSVPTPTKIDELVVQKLKKLGVVPSALSADEEFLRRVSLDVTGTLPTPDEVVAFLADTASDKRARKIDELLERPGYAAWWATRFSDITGNNAQQFNNNQFRNEDSRHWYQWLEARLAKNVPYDEIVAGIVLAKSRRDDQTYTQYCEEMSQYYRKENPTSFAEHDTMPYYWTRRNARTAEDKALTFSYAFLGVRLQCAQCHKHPFDQWSKQDFEHFTAFFTGVQYGFRKEDKAEKDKLQAALGVDTKKPNNEQQKELAKMAVEGKTVPLQEVYLRTPKVNNGKNKKAKENGGSRVITPKTLGGEEVATQDYGDLREALMEWMRSEENPYFARAIVNRVWANYFNVGIIEPPDDQNLANPPSNEALLKHLTDEFIAHKYDLKWLHRTITNSRTYQLSWRPNPTNRLDTRNFSRAVPRRLPAEVAYDALRLATAGKTEATKVCTDVSDRAIGPTTGYQGGKGGASYALLTFGKPARATNCDCERSMEPSLLQTLFLRNDGEMLTLVERGSGWLAEVTKEPGKNKPEQKRNGRRRDLAQAERGLAKVKQKLKSLDKEKDESEIKELEARKKKLESQLADARKTQTKEEAEAKAAAEPTDTKVAPEVVAARGKELVREAYLRTLSRQPTEDEMAKSLAYLSDSATLSAGLRDILWALLNTKEFIVNH